MTAHADLNGSDLRFSTLLSDINKSKWWADCQQTSERLKVGKQTEIRSMSVISSAGLMSALVHQQGSA